MSEADVARPNEDVRIESYRDEATHMQSIVDLIQPELSEPYIVYTYRYFLTQWPDLCFLAYAPQSISDSVIEKDSTDHPAVNGQGNELRPTRDQGQDEVPIGVIVSKLDKHLKGDRLMRGYIAMLSVDPRWRRRGVARRLIQITLARMIEQGAQEIVLETEADNESSLALYERLGFIREKRLYRFYLNGKDSFRLVLPIPRDG